MIVPAMSNIKLSYNHRGYNIRITWKLNFVIQGALDKCHENIKQLLYKEIDIDSLSARNIMACVFVITEILY
jgi:hypothetical protein